MKTELLSPAGDLESAYSAFYFGADAVYLGLRHFSARAEATNFSPEELDEITAYAHANGKKVYVTLNTLIREEEMALMVEQLSLCHRCRVDAVIVQDWGVVRLARHLFPDLALHASTQMAIHNLAGALAMKKMGFTRVVLARELSLTEIRDIQQKSGLEVEVFIHGALCYSYSGLCLFSAMTTGRSANRGRCVYSCRDSFEVNGRQYHPFSMKDLALEKDVLKLEGLSLKIEGRKKTPLYVGAVTDYYRRILDTGRIDGSLSDNLKQIFARPWTKLHLNGHRKDVIEPDFVGHRGLKIGEIGRVLNHTCTFKTAQPIARYDGIQIDVAGQEKPFGFSAENLTVGGKKVFEASAGAEVTLSLPPHHPFIKKGDSVYLASSTRVKGAYHYTKPRPRSYRNRTPIDVDVFIEKDQISAVCGEKAAVVRETLTPARNLAKTEEAVRTAFDKTAETPVQVRTLTVHNTDGLFAPVSVLNELRRQLYAQIQPEIIVPALPETRILQTNLGPARWAVKTDDKAIASVLTDVDEIIYVLSDSDTPESLADLPADKLRLALPVILRPSAPWEKRIEALEQAGFHRWEIGNPAGLSLIAKGSDMTLDATVSVLNTQAVAEALEQGISRVTFSPEDTADNIRRLAEKTGQTALVLYQDVPLFLSANCVRENDCRTCMREHLETEIKNARGRYLLISEKCQTVVTDRRATALPAKALNLPVGLFRIDFCYRKYTPQQARRIVDLIRIGQPVPDTTTGNFEKQIAN